MVYPTLVWTCMAGYVIRVLRSEYACSLSRRYDMRNEDGSDSGSFE